MATDTASSAPWQARPVFISSTFADMQAERNHLRTHVFPRLEEALRERRHEFQSIDLRIGVEVVSLATEAERELMVLKVCLDEIERSRPFLIVLLGDRYGWVPAPERMQAAAQENGYLGQLEGKSVTALEIEIGLIKKDAAQRHRSFIYLRDPLPFDTMAPALAAGYSDAHATDKQAPLRVAGLRALKQRLHDDPELAPRIHRYPAQWDAQAGRITGLQAWGDMVYRHLWEELDAETRARASAPAPSWQQQERFALQNFIDERRRGFTGRDELLQELIDQRQPSKPPPYTPFGGPFGVPPLGGGGPRKRGTLNGADAPLAPWAMCVTGAPGRPCLGCNDCARRSPSRRRVSEHRLHRLHRLEFRPFGVPPSGGLPISIRVNAELRTELRTELRSATSGCECPARPRSPGRGLPTHRR